jgi:hypothetical protein
MRSRASSFKWEYPLLSPRSSSNFLRLLPRLLVTSFCPCCYTNLNHLEHHLLCASSRYWWRCFLHQFLVSLFVWLLPFDLSSKGGPACSYATAGIGFGITAANEGVRGNAVCWDTVLQAERSRVWFPVWSLWFSIYFIPPAVLWPLALLSL